MKGLFSSCIQLNLVFHRLYNSDTKTSKLVHHFHYISWPDFGVPSDPRSLIKFVQHIRNILRPQHTKSPIVVHCSAGVGRSGTYMALDTLLQVGIDCDIRMFNLS